MDGALSATGDVGLECIQSVTLAGCIAHNRGMVVTRSAFTDLHFSIEKTARLITLRLFLPILMAGSVPLPLSAQGSPASSTTPATHLPSATIAPSAPDAAILTKLLQDFLAGASRNDPAMHDRFWADDLIYTSSAGRRIGKADLMRDVRNEAKPAASDEKTIYTAEEIRIQQYETTALVAFRLVATTTKEEKREVANYLNTWMFLKRAGQWQAVAWQATRMPPANEPAK